MNFLCNFFIENNFGQYLHVFSRFSGEFWEMNNPLTVRFRGGLYIAIPRKFSHFFQGCTARVCVWVDIVKSCRLKHLGLAGWLACWVAAWYCIMENKTLFTNTSPSITTPCMIHHKGSYIGENYCHCRISQHDIHLVSCEETVDVWRKRICMWYFMNKWMTIWCCCVWMERFLCWGMMCAFNDD